MMRGMYAAISGLEAHQTMLDVTANNLANVNTVGLQGPADDVRGRALAARARGAPADQGNARHQPGCRSALASRLGSIDNLMTTGSLQSTGNPLDVAIQGDGLPARHHRRPAGNPITATQQVEYTRDGNFTINPRAS